MISKLTKELTNIMYNIDIILRVLQCILYKVYIILYYICLALLSGVCAEVSRVEESHAHILENLNLEVESMLMPPAEQPPHLKAAPASNGSAGLANGSQATTPKEQRENNRDELVKQHSMPVTGRAGPIRCFSKARAFFLSGCK